MAYQAELCRRLRGSIWDQFEEDAGSLVRLRVVDPAQEPELMTFLDFYDLVKEQLALRFWRKATATAPADLHNNWTMVDFSGETPIIHTFKSDSPNLQSPIPNPQSPEGANH
jgi:hypothetical protein